MGLLVLNAKPEFFTGMPVFINGHSIEKMCSGPEAIGNCGCIHAEMKAMNAVFERDLTNISFAANFAPCTPCANLVAWSGRVTKYFFKYITKHDLRGLEILQKYGIKCHQIGVPEGTAISGEHPGQGKLF